MKPNLNIQINKSFRRLSGDSDDELLYIKRRRLQQIIPPSEILESENQDPMIADVAVTNDSLPVIGKVLIFMRIYQIKLIFCI